MKNIIRIIVIAIVFVLTSCLSEPISKNEGHSDYVGGIKLKRADGSFFNEINRDTVLSYDLGKYMEYAYPTDYIAGISSSRLNPLQKEFIYGYSKPYYTCSPTKSYNVKDDGILVNVNDVPLNVLPDTKSEVQRADFKSMFGTTVKYEISSAFETKGHAPESETIELYTPEIIQFSFPKIETEEDLYPLFYYKSFPIRWNEDPNNPNGVIVIVEWTGTMIYGEDHPNAYVRSTDLLYDTGEAFLNPDIFNGIPDTALCTLTILRGNVENVLINDYSCKIAAETHQSIQFILIRNVIENEKVDQNTGF